MGVKVKGKSEAIIKSFVQSWTPQTSYEDSESGKALRQLICGMHRQWVTESDAHLIIRWVPRDALSARSKMWFDPVDDEDKVAMEAAFVEYIESLPKKYELRVPLPRFPNWMPTGAIELAPDVRIVTQGLLGLLGGDFSDSRTYLAVDVEGYADHTASASGATKAAAIAKQTLYFLAHTRAADFWDSLAATVSTGHFVSKNGILRRASPALHRYAAGIEIMESALRIFSGDSAATLLTNGERRPETDEERREALDHIFSEVRGPLSLRTHADFEYVGSAIEWAVEAATVENDAVSFVLCCIGLESLLGSDEHMTGMTQRLADRYAFLTGTTREDREKRAQAFKDLFELRGRLVHARQRGLSPSESSALAKLKVMLDVSIGVEQRNLWQDQARRNSLGRRK